MMQTSGMLSKTDQKALLEQPNTTYPVDLRNLAILQLFLKHGLRLSEQRFLKWEHTDLSSRTLFISGSNGIRDRLIHLLGRPNDTLIAWKERQKNEMKKRLLDHHNRNEPGYVFTTLRGQRVTERYIRRMIKDNARDANIDREVTINTLRRTFARNLYERSQNIRQVQKALGHEDLSTTLMFTDIVPAQLKQNPMAEMITRQH